MILVIYTATKIDAVLEAPQGGVTHHPKNKMPFVGAIEDAKDFFEMKGFDTSKINEYEPINIEE
jgi:hypothetical protein